MGHINEKVDFTVTVYIVYRNTVLLRMHEKYHVWLGPGGHIELGEDPTEAAVREVKEEVGLDVTLAEERMEVKKFNMDNHTALLPPRFLNRHNVSGTHEHVDLIYFAKSNTDRVIAGEHEADAETHWFTREDLDDPQYGVKEDVKYYAEQALDTLST